MIHPDSRSLEWMQQVAIENNFNDITLIEKTIRAFSLLESLVLSGCPFVFKGGTSLMLHLNSAKRLTSKEIKAAPWRLSSNYLI